MVIKEIKGASHGDALPGGRFAALIEGSHFETHAGPVALPPGEPWGLMFVRASDVGGFHFAGLSHQAATPLVWEYRAGVWTSFAAPVGRGCYDRFGVYQDAAPAGYQYCDDGGNMVSRLDTYPVRNGLNEWTERAGIVIGQGNADGGIRVWAGNVLRRLLDGYYIFVNVNRVGNDVTICAWNAPGRVVIVDTSLDELAALPAVSVVAPMPPLVTPSPKPEPKPMPTIPDSEIARAKAEIAAHPLGDNLPDLPWTEARVANLGGDWGLNGKRGDPNNPSHDIFAYRWTRDVSQQPILVDVLGDGGGANIEAFQILDWPEPAGAVWIAPKSVGAGNPPTAPPPSPVSSGPGGQLDAEIRALLDRLAKVENKVVELAARPVPSAPAGLSGRIALKTNDGHYLCAEAGGGGEVNATRTAVGGWETFTVEPQ